MSERRVAALVCEGQTDVPILEEIIHATWDDIDDVLVLQPELDALGKQIPGRAAGWSAVRAWCEQNDLHDVIDPLVGDRIDLLVVAIDVDIAVEAGIADPPVAVGAYDTVRLCNVVKSWLRTAKRRSLPREVVVAIPAMAIEAWVIAALFPRERAPESIQDAAQYLVDKRKLRRSERDGRPHKYLPAYRDFGARVGQQLARVRKSCPEANRLCRKIEVVAAARV